MPFCPRCRDEFQDWVKECPDCKVALVDKLEPLIKPAKSEKPSPPVETLVTIASYSYPARAHLDSAMLEWEGIWSFVANEHIVIANWLYSGIVGGVQLRVNERDVDDARGILEAIKQNQGTVEDAAETCPNCQSSNIQYQTFNIPLIFVIWLVTFILGSKGFTLPFVKRKWKCHDCWYQWKDNNWSAPENA